MCSNGVQLASKSKIGFHYKILHLEEPWYRQRWKIERVLCTVDKSKRIKAQINSENQKEAGGTGILLILCLPHCAFAAQGDGSSSTATGSALPLRRRQQASGTPRPWEILAVLG